MSKNKKYFIHIKNEIRNEHFELLKKIVKSNAEELPVIILDNIVNGKDFQVINNIHEYLRKNEINLGCIIFGSNEFSALLLLSSEYIKYRSATLGTTFVNNYNDYLSKNSTGEDTSSLQNEILNIIYTENPFNSNSIFEIFKTNEDFCVHFAYRFGFVDNLLLIKNEILTDEKIFLSLVDEMRDNTLLYIDRMENIKAYFFEKISKLY
jgi:hypothetical protein